MDQFDMRVLERLRKSLAKLAGQFYPLDLRRSGLSDSPGVVPGFSIDFNCNTNPTKIIPNPNIASLGYSVFTTAVGFADSESGHLVPAANPPSGVIKNNALLPTHNAERPSLVVTSRKFDEVA